MVAELDGRCPRAVIFFSPDFVVGARLLSEAVKAPRLGFHSEPFILAMPSLHLADGIAAISRLRNCVGRTVAKWVLIHGNITKAPDLLNSRLARIAGHPSET